MLTNILLEDNTHELNKSKIIKIFGFWIYLMSDLILFAVLFSVYYVLKNNIANGPTGKEIFDLIFIFTETLLLLFSSGACSLSNISLNENNKKSLIFWLIFTFLFGFCFILMELYEFFHLIIINNFTPKKSAFLSSFFVLIGTHGLHVISGLIWIIVMIIHICYNGITFTNKIRLKCLSLFWHFLDIIWIFVFTTVYLLEMI